MRIRGLLAIGLALATLGGSCEVMTPELDEVGTVRYADLEGGCWLIETDEETYVPINLPQEMRVDGLDVEFEGEIREDIATTCQAGPALELLRIRELGG